MKAIELSGIDWSIVLTPEEYKRCEDIIIKLNMEPKPSVQEFLGRLHMLSDRIREIYSNKKEAEQIA